MKRVININEESFLNNENIKANDKVIIIRVNKLSSRLAITTPNKKNKTEKKKTL